MGELFDKAVALTEQSSVHVDDAVVYEDPVLLEFHSPVTVEPDDAEPRSNSSPFSEPSTSRSSDRDEPDEADLSDNAVDAVLAAIFG